MKRSVSSEESSNAVREVIGAVDLGRAEDVAASETTLVDSVRGAVETSAESTEEGRTAVRRIGSKVSVVTSKC